MCYPVGTGLQSATQLTVSNLLLTKFCQCQNGVSSFAHLLRKRLFVAPVQEILISMKNKTRPTAWRIGFVF
jgi:hypothetical protein